MDINFGVEDITKRYGYRKAKLKDWFLEITGPDQRAIYSYFQDMGVHPDNFNVFVIKGLAVYFCDGTLYIGNVADIVPDTDNG